MKLWHRRAFAALFGTLMLVASGWVSAQPDNYPSKSIRLIVPYPPGGFTDILGRLIAERLSNSLGQPVVIDNKGGGGSTIGTGIAAKAEPDGYTLLLVAPDLAINETLVAKLSYNAARDFAPVIQAAWSPMVLVAQPSLPANSVKEFIDLAKAQPGKINVASGGNGTGAHLALELFRTRAGIDIVHVPYRGNGPATTDLLSGQVAAMFLQMAVARPYITAGKLKALATPSGKRSPAMPDLPTIAEYGFSGFDVTPWFGIVAPAGTPATIVDRLNKEIAAIMKRPDVRKQLANQGAEAVTSTPAEFSAFIQSEIVRWGKVVKDSGIRIE